jgi:hypothetical protein
LKKFRFFFALSIKAKQVGLWMVMRKTKEKFEIFDVFPVL